MNPKNFLLNNRHTLILSLFNSSYILLIYGLIFFSPSVKAQSDSSQQTYVDVAYHAIDSLVEVKNFSEAMVLLQELKNEVIAKEGYVHPLTAEVIVYEAEIFGFLKNMNETVNSYTEALEIRRKIPSELNGCYSILNNLGYIYRNMGLYSKSEISFIESEKIFREIYGDTIPELAVVLNNKGGLYKDMGEFEKAEKSFLEGIKVNEMNFGVDCVENAILYNNLGGLYRQMGNLKLAEYYYLKLYQLFLSKLGNQHPKFGSALNNLAVLYSDLGDYKKSENLQLEALNNSISKDTASYITNCINIGTLYAKMNEYEKAENYLKKALALQEVFYNENHREISKLYSVLGNFYVQTGDYVEAEKYLNKTLEKYSLTHGEDSHEYGFALLSLSYLKFYQKDFETSLELSNTGFQIVQKNVGIRHSLYITVVKKTAYIYFKTGKFDEAEKMYLELVKVQSDLIKEQFTFLSEVEKELYLKKIMVAFDEFCTFALHRKQTNPAITGNVYDLILNTKGVLLKSSTLVRKLILNSGDEALIDNYETWISLKKKIVNLNNIPVEKRKEDPKVLEEKAELLEKEFTQKVVDFSAMTEVMDESWIEVQKSLDQKEALIEFMHFQTTPDSVLYCALVLKASSEYPEMIPLFEEKQLLEILNSNTNRKSINDLYGTKLKRNSSLYNLVWQPLESTLSQIKKVHVSPSGHLHKISFAGLCKDDGSFLIDDKDLNFTSSTAFFNKDATFQPAENTSISLFGGIQYSSDSSSSYPWQYLTGTKIETDALVRAFKKYVGTINYLTGENATKTNFVNIASKSNILHIATHGFFFPDPEVLMNSLIDTSESGEINFRGGPSRATDLFVNSQNPLMRSGLVFAGANDYWNGFDDGGDDNGIITALDVINLNLSNTRMVVMSACESGLGDIVDGEGVYGLQRAFKMAGADFLVMSLWQVPDKETAEFMELFYTYLFKKKDIREAFKLTQETFRKKYDPYYWAAFTLIQ